MTLEDIAILAEELAAAPKKRGTYKKRNDKIGQ
jgi:hypothetical protein